MNIIEIVYLYLKKQNVLNVFSYVNWNEIILPERETNNILLVRVLYIFGINGCLVSSLN